jgi:hypothetical protein
MKDLVQDPRVLEAMNFSLTIVGSKPIGLELVGLIS